MPAIPEGFTTLTPSIAVKDAAKAIDLYKKAFGAKEIDRLEHPETRKIVHAVLEVGNAKFFICDEIPGMAKATHSVFYLYVPDADAAMQQATKAGLKQLMAPEDMFWGDRLGAVTDEFGNQWSIATHKRDVAPDEMKKGAQDMFAKMKEKGANCPSEMQEKQARSA